MTTLTWDVSSDINVAGYAGGIRTTSGGSLPQDYTLYDLGNTQIWLLPPTLPTGTYYIRIFSYVSFSDQETYGISNDEIEVNHIQATVPGSQVTLIAVPSTIYLGTTALLIFAGPANTSIEWSVVGDGVLSNVMTSTDSVGAATAVLTANTAGSIGVSVDYGV